MIPLRFHIRHLRVNTQALQNRLLIAPRIAAQSRTVASTTAPQTPPPSNSDEKPTPTPPTQPPTSKAKEAPTLKPLDRPLGIPSPPLPGQNSGIDLRTWRERRDDFFNYDKHLERRQELTRKVAKPYFRDWTNLRFHKGKLFLAPSRLLRADKAFYFPNLRGFTLAEPKDEQDTTNVLKGAVSIVRIFTGRWAERQADTWTNALAPLRELLMAGKEVVQVININVEENGMKSRLVKMFMTWHRRSMPKEAHAKQFLVTKGLTEDLRHTLGMFNTQVGYVFLVDQNCRVRWAGCAEANAEERDHMVKGLGKLVSEMKKLQDVGEGPQSPIIRQRLNSLTNRMQAIMSL
ncbi:Mitochondrial ATPase complex subunit atp10 [Thelotrema lepadinum]|nr:Mitochondrial ATPase complex subunit atp10 [Thelotrema lepadinum]